MCKLAFALACLTCACHGRREPLMKKSMQSSLHVEPHNSSEQGSTASSLEGQSSGPFKGLAMLLSAFSNPAVGSHVTGRSDNLGTSQLQSKSLAHLEGMGEQKAKTVEKLASRPLPVNQLRPKISIPAGSHIRMELPDETKERPEEQAVEKADEPSAAQSEMMAAFSARLDQEGGATRLDIESKTKNAAGTVTQTIERSTNNIGDAVWDFLDLDGKWGNREFSQGVDEWRFVVFFLLIGFAVVSIKVCFFPNFAPGIDIDEITRNAQYNPALAASSGDVDVFRRDY
mmetsp:Transcript_98982/g.171529  ORF Transcript_98982/g.171529 Transcript_98982/m.171529 type:complete len:286 (-) Transcript_98982:65-922(-)